MTEQIILIGDVREQLDTLKDQYVQCCVTSPPYYGLRDYGVAGQIGLEPTLAEYIATMVDVFRGVHRVLRDDGTLWLNIGDSYAGGNYRGGGIENASEKQRSNAGTADFMRRTPPPIPSGMKPKDLMMVPARLAIALQDDGWYLRSDIIWAKPNPMPESVRDRPTSAHEHIFLLTKQARYYYDADAIREPHTDSKVVDGEFVGSGGVNRDGYIPNNQGFAGGSGVVMKSREYNPLGRNSRNVWAINPKPFSEAHFATFPPEIPRRCIKAGSREGDTILDPFLGSGTTLAEAQVLGRNGIGVELNREYAEIARRRVSSAAPLFGSVEVREYVYGTETKATDLRR